MSSQGHMTKEFSSLLVAVMKATAKEDKRLSTGSGGRGHIVRIDPRGVTTLSPWAAVHLRHRDLNFGFSALVKSQDLIGAIPSPRAGGVSMRKEDGTIMVTQGAVTVEVPEADDAHTDTTHAKIFGRMGDRMETTGVQLQLGRTPAAVLRVIADAENNAGPTITPLNYKSIGVEALVGQVQVFAILPCHVMDAPDASDGLRHILSTLLSDAAS